MTSTATSPAAYLESIPEQFRAAFEQLRETVLANIPEGFKEVMQYGMITFVVPHGLYPSGYHCDPQAPLPFVSIAAQKNFVALYHMGIYADQNLLSWFTTEYPRHSSARLDMGKSCIRFKKQEHIPYELIGQLLQKISVADWIALYESKFKR